MIDNQKLYAAIVQYQAFRTELSDRIIFETISKLVDDLMHKPEFYDDVLHMWADVQQEAIMFCILYVPTFNTFKYDNPYVYFSQIAHSSIYGSISKERLENRKYE